MSEFGKKHVIGTQKDSASSNTISNTMGKTKLCFVGSSLTQHGNGITPTKVSTDTRGWPCWLMMLLQNSCVAEQWQYLDPATSKLFSVGSNRGFSGQFSAQIDARKADIAAMKADVYIVQQGTNDLSSVDIGTTIANVTSTAKYLRDTGAIVLLLGEPPRNFSVGGGWESGGAAQKRRGALNKAKEELARSERGIYYVNVDPYLMQGTGESKPGYNYDGIHFSPVGAFNYACAVYDVLSKLVPAIPKTINAQDVYDATYNPKGNLLPNPTLASLASGFTKSSLPTGVTGFTVTNNPDGTATLTITTDGTGAAGSASSVYLQQASPVTHGTSEAVSVGVKIKQITQADTLYGVRAYVRVSKTGQTSTYGFGAEKYISSSFPNSKTTYWPVTAVNLYNKTPKIPVPWADATVTGGVYVDVNAGVAGTNIIVLEGVDMRSSDLPWNILGVSQDVGYATQNYYGGTDV